MGPAGRNVVERGRPSDLIEVAEDVGCRHLHVVLVGHLVERAVMAGLGRRTVVAQDVEDEGVVENPLVLQRREQPRHLVIGVGGHRGVCLDQSAAD